MNHTSVAYLSEDTISHLFTYSNNLILSIHLHTLVEATQLFVELDVTSIQAGPCLAVGFAEDSVQDSAWFVPG